MTRIKNNWNFIIEAYEKNIDPRQKGFWYKQSVTTVIIMIDRSIVEKIGK